LACLLTISIYIVFGTNSLKRTDVPLNKKQTNEQIPQMSLDLIREKTRAQQRGQHISFYLTVSRAALIIIVTLKLKLRILIILIIRLMPNP